MKILACVKQVLDGESVFRIRKDSDWIETEGDPRYGMNHPDEFVVEEAVALKEAHREVTVDVLTVGPHRASQVLERAVGMGADRAYHILTREEGYLAPLTVSSWIAGFAETRNYDLILCGIMAEDDMQGQVGPMLAEHLGYPCATSVVRETCRPETETIRVEREIEGGRRELLEIALPAVLTLQTGINRPRYPSLSNLLRAKKEKPEILDPARFPMPEDRERFLRAALPPAVRRGVVLEGDTEQKARELHRILKEMAFL